MAAPGLPHLNVPDQAAAKRLMRVGRRSRPSGERGGAAAGGAEPPRGPRGAAAPRKEEGVVRPPPRRARRKGMQTQAQLRMRRELAPIQRRTQRLCGTAPIPGKDIEIYSHDGVVGEKFDPTNAGANIRGLQLCGSPWSCPYCAPRIRGVRATDLEQLVSWHGADLTMMVTFTIRHGAGDAIKKTRTGLEKARRRMTSGKPWERFKEAIGWVGSVRAIEVTHGKNGWHPHTHDLLLVLDRDALTEWLPWLKERWRRCVVAVLGEDYAPSDERGVVITPASDGTYLSKMEAAALELTDAAGAKGAKGGNRTPWEIAQAALLELKSGAFGHDVALWRDYAEGMKGARALTWSRGLKKAAGIIEMHDAEAVKRTGEGAGTVLAVIPEQAWYLVVAAPDGEVQIIMAALYGGQVAVTRQLREWQRRYGRRRRRAA